MWPLAMNCRSTSQWLATWQADKDKDPIAILETIPLANVSCDAAGYKLLSSDVLKLLGIITYIQHPLGYKCRVEENNHAWLGANPRHLEDELAFRQQMRTSHISTRSVHKPASCR